MKNDKVHIRLKNQKRYPMTEKVEKNRKMQEMTSGLAQFWAMFV